MSSTFEGVSREALEGLVQDYERALRASYGEAGLPEEWEANLRAISRDSPFGLLKYWKWLAIYSELRSQARQKTRAAAPRGATEAARQLLRREPIRVTMENGRVVEVTSRSYSAAAEIQAHAYAVRDLEAALRASPPPERALVRRIHFEIELHRRAVWAHAFTPSGAPAGSLEEAPAWWREITPEDDGRFLAALLEAGPLRYAQLGEAPAREESGVAAKGIAEDLGWGTLFAMIEREQRLPAAALYDRDLYQMLAWQRAGASAAPELGG